MALEMFVQFRDSPKFRAFLQVPFDKIGAAIQVFRDIVTKRAIGAAEGEQAQRNLETVGIGRLSFSDAVLREITRVGILANTSHGSPDQSMEVASRLAAQMLIPDPYPVDEILYELPFTGDSNTYADQQGIAGATGFVKARRTVDGYVNGSGGKLKIGRVAGGSNSVAGIATLKDIQGNFEYATDLRITFGLQTLDTTLDFSGDTTAYAHLDPILNHESAAKALNSGGGSTTAGGGVLTLTDPSGTSHGLFSLNGRVGDFAGANAYIYKGKYVSGGAGSSLLMFQLGKDQAAVNDSIQVFADVGIVDTDMQFRANYFHPTLGLQTLLAPTSFIPVGEQFTITLERTGGNFVITITSATLGVVTTSIAVTSVKDGTLPMFTTIKASTSSGTTVWEVDDISGLALSSRTADISLYGGHLAEPGVDAVVHDVRARLYNDGSFDIGTAKVKTTYRSRNGTETTLFETSAFPVNENVRVKINRSAGILTVSAIGTTIGTVTANAALTLVNAGVDPWFFGVARVKTVLTDDDYEIDDVKADKLTDGGDATLVRYEERDFARSVLTCQTHIGSQYYDIVSDLIGRTKPAGVRYEIRAEHVSRPFVRRLKNYDPAPVKFVSFAGDDGLDEHADEAAYFDRLAMIHSAEVGGEFEFNGASDAEVAPPSSVRIGRLFGKYAAFRNFVYKVRGRNVSSTAVNFWLRLATTRGDNNFPANLLLLQAQRLPSTNIQFGWDFGPGIQFFANEIPDGEPFTFELRRIGSVFIGTIASPTFGTETKSVEVLDVPGIVTGDEFIYGYVEATCASPGGACWRADDLYIVPRCYDTLQARRGDGFSSLASPEEGGKWTTLVRKGR